eukprot:COSAG06_NODE_38527_length_422_cov_1.278638_1_plen_58_part_01
MEAAARIGDTGFAPTFCQLRLACHARSRRVGRAGVHVVGAMCGVGEVWGILILRWAWF